MLGQRLNNFEIVRLLGEGGMGAVYEAEHQLIRRKVAVKVLKRELALDSDLVQRFFNEARATSAIRHPNIIEVVDVGKLPDGVPYLVMELLEGETLGDRLDRLGRLDVAQAVDFMRQAASALEAAHDKGIIHRDLKPDNLFLVPDQRFSERELVKVLDFGIAKLRGDVGIVPVDTVAGAVFGTPPYMSPEQCRGLPSELDQRTDIYALGIILYETLCGLPPFIGEGIGDVMMQHMSAEPTPPTVLCPDLPVHIERVILKALAKRREDRFPSMAEFRAALGPTAAPIVALSEPAHASARAGSVRSASAPAGSLAVAGGRAGGFAEPARISGPAGSERASAGDEGTESTGSRLKAERAPRLLHAHAPLDEAGEGRTLPLAAVPPANRFDSDAPTGAHAARGASASSKRAPWAVVAFGLIAALAAVLFLRIDEASPNAAEPTHTAMPAQSQPPAPTPTAPKPLPAAVAPPLAPAAVEAPPSAAVHELERHREPDRHHATTSGHTHARAPAPSGQSAGVEAAAAPAGPARPSATSAASPAAPAETAGSEPGYLSLDSAPWSDVFLGSKLLGTTPLIHVALPPGRYVLTLKNSELGKSTSYVVEIKSGKTVSRLVGWEK